ncbi:MAG: serine hydrolase [Acidobacteriota bacterium]
MARWLIAAFLLFPSLPTLASDRVPGDRWMAYANPAEAGFDVAALAAAEERWRELSSSAFMVIADGAVVASWGETDRRFMCHSVRKSFLSALYGIYWDRDQMELNKTLADVGIDDLGDGLLESEKQARILDLLKARSGVFHPAAYAGRTDSRPRGSEGPGRYFAYNNWDFNTLATILEKETGDTVFEAFDEHFARPLAMEDWRLSDGYFHYERDKSEHPAYPFRMSARDAARFGLLFARDGRWGDEQILSRQWVRRSTALYSKDNEQFGYGFMWWVALEPRFAEHGFVAARGVGRQMIVALPDIDMVIVNRANTYRGEGTEYQELLDLMEMVIAARRGEAADNPRLVPLGAASKALESAPGQSSLVAELVGEYAFPPAPLGLPERTRVEARNQDGRLIMHSPAAGTFEHFPQGGDWLLEEDSYDRYRVIRDASGKIAGVADADTILQGAVMASVRGDGATERRLKALIADEEGLGVELGRTLLALFERPKKTEKAIRALITDQRRGEIEGRINGFGYRYLQADAHHKARRVFELNTRLFPQAYNTWDSLGEACMILGEKEEAIANYQKSLELNPENDNARDQIAKLRSGDG